MRILLATQKGCMSFATIQTVNRVIHETYQSAFDAIGLLGDDAEWHGAITEATVWATSSEIRSLFTYLLLFCDLSNPTNLWTEKLSKDIIFDYRRQTHVGYHELSDHDFKQHVLFKLELFLNASTGSPSLGDFGLPMPSAEGMCALEDHLLMEE
jgi:hypothetical protein